MGLFSFLSKNKQDTDDDLDVPVRPRRSRSTKAQEDEPMDPMLPEKKRARRRLIGASALVLAAVIGLPMIFDSEPKPLADDINIQIPAREKSSTSGNTPMPLPPAALPEVKDTTAETSQAADADKPLPAIKASAPVPELRALRSTEAVPAPKPAADKASDKSADKPADKTPVSTSSPVPEKHLVKAEATAPAKSTLKSAEKPADKSSDKFNDKATNKHADKEKSKAYIVQVAAVTDKAKAEQLQKRLKQAGIKSYSQKISSKDGERFRIRVGPFSNREEADKMRVRLNKMGLTGSLQPV